MFWVQIESNSVAPCNISHCETSTFDNHFDNRLIVVKDIEHGTSTRVHCVRWNVVKVCWNDVGVLELDVVVRVWLGGLQRVSSELSLGSICSVRYGMIYFNHQIPRARACIKSSYVTFCRAV